MMLIKVLLVLAVLCLFLMGCSSRQVEVSVGQRFDVTEKVRECVVYDDRVECLLVDGNYYYARMDVLERISRWDKSAWAVK